MARRRPPLDAEERVKRIQEFTDRIEWRRVPGAYAHPTRASLARPPVFQRAIYQRALPGVTGLEIGRALTAADELTLAAESELVRILATLDSDVRAAVVDDIAARVWQFRLDRIGRSTPNGRAFRAWVRRAVPKLREFERWLSRDPLPKPVPMNYEGDPAERLTYERQYLLERVGDFRQWLDDTYDPSRPRKRPVDVPKADLVEGIGETLWLAGCHMTNSETGVFAQVLRQVLGDVNELRNRASVRRTVIEASKHRHHWRPGKRIR